MLALFAGTGVLALVVTVEAWAACSRRRQRRRLAALQAEAEAALREARLSRLALEAMVRPAPAPRELCRN